MTIAELIHELKQHMWELGGRAIVNVDAREIVRVDVSADVVDLISIPTDEAGRPKHLRVSGDHLTKERIQ
jgi:hypothetical protein